MKKMLLAALLPALFGCVEQNTSSPAPAGGECSFVSDEDFCNGRDDDCDGQTDEDCERTDAGTPDRRPDQMPPAACRADSDCEDSDPCTWDICSTDEGCLNINQCEPPPPPPPCGRPESDCDSDGVTVAAGDCDDSDSLRSPLLAEDAEHGNLNDGKDNDCDVVADEWGPGLDSDGDAVPDRTDCDPTNPERWPGAPEICGDGIDSDCNGSDSTDQWGSCFTSVGTLDGLPTNPSVRVAIVGNITSGLISEPDGAIYRVSVGSDANNWDASADDEWTPWLGDGNVYSLRVLHRPDVGFNVRVRAENVAYLDLRKWQLTGALRRVPASHGQWGLVIITP